MPVCSYTELWNVLRLCLQIVPCSCKIVGISSSIEEVTFVAPLPAMSGRTTVMKRGTEHAMALCLFFSGRRPGAVISSLAVLTLIQMSTKIRWGGGESNDSFFNVNIGCYNTHHITLLLREVFCLPLINVLSGLICLHSHLAATQWCPA